VWAKKANESEPSMMSLSLGDIETRALMLSWDKPEGNLFTALVVSGMKVARAWLGLCKGTGELLDMIQVSVD
jgi:hypothetical protein